MGYSTLTIGAGQTLAEAVRADLQGSARSGIVVLFQAGGDHGRPDGDVHSIIGARKGEAPQWIVSRVVRGLVKHMPEDVAPYCDAPDAEFLHLAKAVMAPPATKWAKEWRECMYAGERYPFPA